MIDHFNLIAPFYDGIFGFLDTRRLRGLLHPPVQGWLLDVGGGTGRVVVTLRDEAGCLVVLDESAAMVQQARRKGLVVVQGRAEMLPFASAVFERIIMVDAFHHLRDQDRAVRELQRVLAPGGRVVVEEPNPERLPVRLVALVERLLLMRSRFFSPEAVRQLFAAGGGQARIEQEGMNFWVIYSEG